MGLGKTFVGSEKLNELGEKINLVICQKSKIKDWIDHFNEYYPNYEVWDLTNKTEHCIFLSQNGMIKNAKIKIIGVINYDLIFRRKQLMKEINNFTLMLDESSIIQNETSKRSKAILKLKPKNVILLSGTPTSGKYENLWSQCKLLGWNISKKLYWSQYIVLEYLDIGTEFMVPVVKGYKNVTRLKEKLREYGSIFMKTNEVMNLPKQIDQFISVKKTKEYNKFYKDSIITITEEGNIFKDDSDFYGKDVTPRIELVGDTTLTKRLYLRMLASGYNINKLEALKDLFNSTEDRLIVFYNFNQELHNLKKLVPKEKPISIINGEIKDLENYESYNNSITFIQYQAGAMGLNLQKSNKIIYFSLPERSELFEQSKKRTHRIGQTKSCFYYYMIAKNSIDEDIFETLKMRRNYTDELFRQKHAKII